jgi:hypothetical protein
MGLVLFDPEIKLRRMSVALEILYLLNKNARLHLYEFSASPDLYLEMGRPTELTMCLPRRRI